LQLVLVFQGTTISTTSARIATDDGERRFGMKDWTHQERNGSDPGSSTGSGFSGIERINTAAQRQAWAGRYVDAIGRTAEDSVKRRRTGLAAVILGGTMMVAGAAMVAAAVL
jgi:hypothetical protein